MNFVLTAFFGGMNPLKISLSVGRKLAAIFRELANRAASRLGGFTVAVETRGSCFAG